LPGRTPSVHSAAETKVEQHRSAVLRSQRAVIGVEFGQHGAPVHCAFVGGQAKGNPLAPARFGDAFERKWPAFI
jgi:hypothetical protein